MNYDSKLIPNNFLFSFQRTAEQIRKCWENMKSKRKLELAKEKRQRMATGGGPFPGQSTVDDPDIDAAVFSNVNIEVQDVIDNDTLALLANKTDDATYTILQDGSLASNNEELTNYGVLQEGYEISSQSSK